MKKEKRKKRKSVFALDGRVAVISDALDFLTLGRGKTVTMYSVRINGKRAFHATDRSTAVDWLTRQGYR